MGIIRLITVVAVIWLIWFVFKRFQQNLIDKKSISAKEVSVSSVKKCAVCGVYVPENEALVNNGRYYCGAAHKNKDTNSDVN